MNPCFSILSGVKFIHIYIFFLFGVFIYLYLGLVGGDKTYKIEPPDPITLSKKTVLQRIHRYKNKHDLKIMIMIKKGKKVI